MRLRFLVVVTSVIVASLSCGSRDGDTIFAAPKEDATAPGDFGGDAGDAAPELVVRDPTDCEEAAKTRSYVGCDYWPTVTANGVWSIFDFAAVVANTGAKPAEVTVTGPNAVDVHVTVPPGELRKIPLPWVPALKGGDVDECGNLAGPAATVLAPESAYHLVSTTPVTVYQFNALQYEAESPDAGGAKDWSSCIGTTKACVPDVPPPLKPVPQLAGCYSFSNDASLLLPSTALTGTYRITGQRGYSANGKDIDGAFIAITATQPATKVTVALASKANIVASTSGPAIAAANGGTTIELVLANAGDVVELATPKGSANDLSGSTVHASAPVQVIAGNPCLELPPGKPACDHIEETVLPAETLGKTYVVAPPTGPKGTAVHHIVRFYGNTNGTALTYAPSKPFGCPVSLDAGQVVECEATTDAFEVSATHEIAITTFLLGARYFDPHGADRRGDPSATNAIAIEQFRTSYVFLAPDDYPDAFADIIAPPGANIVLDGAPVTAALAPIAKYGVVRVKLDAQKGGAHVLTASAPVGVEVVGYGANTSYHYPAGMNLSLLAPPPPGPK